MMVTGMWGVIAAEDPEGIQIAKLPQSAATVRCAGNFM